MYFAKIIPAFFPSRGVLDIVIMAMNLGQNNQLADLILTNGSDLEDAFSNSGLEEDLSDESDSLESLPSGESSFLQGLYSFELLNFHDFP